MNNLRTISTRRPTTNPRSWFVVAAMLFLLPLVSFAQTDKIWVGGTSTAWSTAGNWSPSGVPTNAHNVRIPLRTNAPVLSAASVARTVTFLDSLGTGTATLTVGTQTLTVGTAGFPGDMTINNNGTLSISTGTVDLTIGGSMTLNSGGVITMSGAGTIAVSGNWTNNGGTMSNTSGTVSFTGTGVSQTIDGSGSTTFPAVSLAATAGTYTMNNDNTATSLTFVAGAANTTLALGGTSQLDVSGAVTMNPTASGTINKTLDVANGALTAASLTMATSGNNGRDCILILGGGSATFTGDVTMASNVARHHIDWTGSGTLTVGGNMTGGGLTTGGNGTVVYDGSGAQTAGGAYTYNHLTINKPVNTTATIGGNTTIGGDLSVLSGSLEFGAFSASVAGTTTVNGYLIVTSASGAKTFSDVLVSGGGTLNYTATETWTINGNLTLAGGTINGSATGIFNVAGNFSVPSGLDTLGQATITVTGTTDIDGTLEIASAVGNKTFAGTVTVNNGATWNNSANSAILFRGGIDNEGTFNAGTGTHTFNTNSQTLSGASPLDFGGIVAITGAVTITNQNTGGVTIASNLTGSVGGSTWLNDTNTSLSIGGALLGTGTLTATANGNTVTYNGTASQTINDAIYYNLGISNTAATGATVASDLTIANDLTVSGTGSYLRIGNNNTLRNMTIGGAVVVGNGATFDVNAGSNNTHSVSVVGNVTNDGTFNFATDGNSFSTLTLNGSGTQAVGGSSSYTLRNINIDNIANPVQIESDITTGGIVTVAANAILEPLAGVRFNGGGAAGTLTGNGTVKVTRTAATPDFVTQYAFTTMTLANLTVDYIATGAQTVNDLNYGNLTISGSRGSNDVTFANSGTIGVAGVFSLAASFGSGGYITTGSTVSYNGSSVQTAVGLDYNNLTIANAAGVAMGGNIAVNGTLTLTSGTFTVGANTLTFNGEPIAGTETNLSAGSTSSLVFNGTAFFLTIPDNISDLNNLTINVSPSTNKVSHYGGVLTIHTLLTLTDGILEKFGGTADTMAIASTGTLVRSDGRIRGALRQYVPTGNPTLYFPIGGNDLLTPVEVSFTNVTTPGDLTVQMEFGEHPSIATSGIDASKSANRRFYFNPNGPAFTSFSVRLGQGGTIPDIDAGATATNFIMRRYDGANWHKTTTGARTDTSCAATGLTAFGDLQVGEQLVKTWDGGAATSNWGDANNWEPNGVPTALEDVSLVSALSIDINVAAFTNTTTFNNAGLVVTIQPGQSLTVTGDFTLTSGTLNTEAAFPTVTGSVTLTGGTVGYTASSGSQTVVVQLYPNLVMSGGGTKTLDGTITPAGDLTISGGTFDMGTFTANRSTSGGTWTVANGATVKIAGTNTRPTNYNTHSIGETSTIEYGGSNQTIGALNSSQSYGHLTLSGSGTKSFPSGTTGIRGTFTVTGVSVSTGSSTIDYNGSGSQTIRPLDYNNLAFSTSGTKTFAAGTTRIAGSFTIGGSATADATSNATTIEYNGSSSQTVPAFTYDDLTINNGSGVTLGGSFTVNDVLTLTSGTITTTGSYTLTIASAGTVFRTSGHIIGKLAKTVSAGSPSPTFEVGDVGRYDPVDVSFTGVSNPGTLTVSAPSGDHSQIITSGIDGAKSVNRYWTLTNSGIAFTSYDGTFHYESGEIDGGANPNDFIIGLYNGSSWALPTVGTLTGTSSQATGLTSFGDFQIGEADAGTTKTWDGGAGTNNWGDGNNWNPNGVPISTDNINLSDANTIDINVAAVCNSITLNNAGLTLTILSTRSLTVSGNFTLTNGTFNTEQAFPSVTGTISITGGTVGYTASSGSQTVSVQNYNNLELSNNATKTFAAGSFGIAGNFTVSGGSVDAATNLTTIDFDGSGSQAVAAIDYYTLIFSNSGARTFASGTARIGRDFYVAGGTASAATNSTAVEFNASSGTQDVAAIDYYGLTFSNAGTRIIEMGTVRIAGGFTVSGGSVTADGSLVEFNGTGTQNVPAINYDDLTFSNSGTRVFSNGTAGIAGDFTVSGGSTDATTNSTTVDFNGTGNQAIAAINYHNLTVTNNGGTKTVASGTTGVAGNFVVTAGSISATANSTTIDFNGSGSQAVAAINYHNLTFSNGGTKTFATGTIGIAANFTITGGSAVATGTTVDFNGTGTQNVAAMNYNNLTFSNTGTRVFGSGTTGIAGDFTASSGFANTTTNSATIDFNGSGTQAVAAINYHNITFSSGGTKRFASGTSRIANTFSVTGGSADATTNTPTIEYNGSSSQTVRGISYHNLTINNSAGTTVSADVAVSGTLNFITGTISTASNKMTITSTGTVTRTSGHVIGNFEKYIPTITPSRTFEIGTGSDYTPAVVAFASVSTPNYLTVSTATGDHAQIGSSILEPNKSANRTWTLTNGGVVFTSYGVTFNFVSGDLDPSATPNNFLVGRYSGSWSYPTVGTKTSSSTEATGLASGEFGDFQLAEEAGLTKTWDGGALTINWGDANNWNPDGVPTSGDNVDLTGADTIEVNVAATANSLLLNNADLLLTILFGNSITVSGNLTMADGTLNTEASFPTVSGSASLNGGEVGYIRGGAQTVSAQTYHRLRFGTSGLKTAGGDLTVNSTFLTDGSARFASGNSLTHTFHGDWIINSSAVTPFTFATANTLNFNTPSPAGSRSLGGSTTRTLGFNTVNFNNTSGFDVNLNFSASGTVTVGTSVVLTPGASNIISGSGTLTGTGTVKVTRTAATPDFSSQYTITNKTLTNLTVDYAGSGQELSNLTYGGLRVSGSITGATNTATVANAFTVTGTFTPSGGTVTVNAGGSILNSGGTLTFLNLTAAGTGTVSTSSSFAVAAALTVDAATTFNASSGTITMNGGSSISNSNALTFSGLTIGTGSAVTTSSNFTVTGALSVQGSATFAPAGGTITMNNGASISNSGSLTFSSLTLPGSATVTTSSSLSIGGALTVGSSANFSPSAGTITMNNGSSIVNSGTLSFQGLTIAASASVTTSGAMTVGTTLTIGSSGTFTPSGAVTVNGDVGNSGSHTGSGTIILSGGASAHALSGGGSFTSLQLNDTQGATLSANTTVNGTLTLTAGKLTTGANRVTISSTGSVSRTSGYVVGDLEKHVPDGSSIVRTFEIGDASNYTPVDMTIDQVSGGGGFILANTTGSDHPNIATANIDPTSSANRYWTLSSAITFTTVDITLNFVSGDVDGGAAPLQFIVGQYAGSWSYPTVGTKTSTSTQATGVSAFGDFQLGQQFGGAYTSTAAGGNWSLTSTWSGGQVPSLNADVVIATTGANFVSIDVNTGNLRSVTIDNGAILQGGGTFTLTIGADGGDDFVNDGTFTANNVTVKLNKNSQWSGTGTFGLRNIDLNSKTLTLAFASPNTVLLSGAGDPFVNAGTLTPGSNSTIEYNGTSGQSISGSAGISFHHLRITNSATVTLQKSLTGSNLAGDLTITSGGVLNTANGSTAFEITGTGSATLTVGASSTLNLGGSGSAASSFPGGFGTVSIDQASTVQYSNSSSVAQTVSATQTYGDVLFSGSGSKNLGSGSFNIAGNWTNNSTGGSLNTGTSAVALTGSGKTIGGAAATTFATVNIEGTYTNNATTQIGTALGGSGTLTQGSAATLNINFGGSVALTSLDASAAGNTVNYQFAGAQNVRLMSYTNLTLSGSGTKTIPSGTTTISGIFTVTGVTVDAITNSSTVDYNGGGDQDVAAFGYHNITFSNAGVKYFPNATTQIAGSLSITGSASANTVDNTSTVEFNGTSAQTINSLTYYNLILTNAGVKTFDTSTTTNADLTLNSGVTMVVDNAVVLQVNGEFNLAGSVTNNGTINVGN